MTATTLCCLGLLAYAAPPPSIGIYDLTYALKFDAGDSQQVAAAWDHAHAVATLQGIVNRDGPRLYVRFVAARGVQCDDYWLDRLSAPGQWLERVRREPIPDLTTLINTYRRFINGVVLYDPKVPATSNLASTLAGVEDLIAIRYDPRGGSLYSTLVAGGPRLPVVRRLLREDGTSMFTGQGTIPDTDMPSTGSAKCDAYLWLNHQFIATGKVDAAFAAFYLDAWWMNNPAAASPNQHTLTNHDYFVAHRAFFFDLGIWGDETPVDDPKQKPGTDLATLKALLRTAYDQVGAQRMIHIGGFTPWAYKYTNHPKAGGKHEGVPTEWELTRIASAYNAFIDADALGDAAMANASFYQHFPLQPYYPQPWTTRQDLAERGYLDSHGHVRLEKRQFIIFYVGDFDSAAWVYQWMPKLWDDPKRGQVPLMWCISPVVERRAPMVLDYLRRTATHADYFAAADNGAGYLNPGMLQAPRAVSALPEALDLWARHCQPFYRRWDLTITGFIIDGYAPGLSTAGLDCYARFSPNGIMPQQVPATLLHGDLPVLRAGYDLPGDPANAAALITQRVAVRTIPFHWFRAILKSPSWYAEVVARLKAEHPEIELLDAPTFFELYRTWLKEHPDAAQGKIDSPR